MVVEIESDEHPEKASKGGGGAGWICFTLTANYIR
jgi:hypothetical protein